MRWRTGRRSENVEDRRGQRIGRGVAGGGIGAAILALVAMYLGIDPNILIQGGSSVGMAPTPSSTAAPPANDPMRDFVSVVLADTEDTWQALFRRMNRTYQDPTLVLFSNSVNSACGYARAAMGPFYCPADAKVYIDLSFYQDLKQRFRAPGDFAQAYVIAHEIGHHVQNLLGIAPRIHALREQVDETQANALSVMMELQADCFAGVWAHHADRARQILEAGDIEEALNAASAIGDDRLQRQSMGYVIPESFTHGSSAQRAHWFRQGLTTGDMQSCNTFQAAY